MERWNGRKRGSALARRCTFQALPKLDIYCVYQPPNINTAEDKQMYISFGVSFLDTLIRAEINIPAEKSISLPLPSQLIAISVVLVVLEAEQRSVARVYARGLLATFQQPQLNKWSNAQREGPTHLKLQVNITALCEILKCFFYGIGTPLKTVFLFSVFHLASHFSPAFVGEQKPSPQFPLSPPFSYLGLRVATVTDLRERSCWFEAAGGGGEI